MEEMSLESDIEWERYRDREEREGGKEGFERENIGNLFMELVGNKFCL